MTKTKRPAERLAAEIADEIRLATLVGWPDITPTTLRRWHRLAKSVDARMRLDGSKLNRKKSAGAGRKRVTR